MDTVDTQKQLLSELPSPSKKFLIPFGFVVHNKAEEIYHKTGSRFLTAYMFLVICYLPDSVLSAR